MELPLVVPPFVRGAEFSPASAGAALGLEQLEDCRENLGCRAALERLFALE
jgi:hypothetical protein